MSICSNCFSSFLQTSCWNYYGVIKRNNVFYLPGVVSHKWPLALASCAKNMTPFKCQISYDINCPWFVCLYVIACHILIRSQKHIVQCLEDLFFLFLLSSATADNDDWTPVTKGGTISTALPSLCLETSLFCMTFGTENGCCTNSTVSHSHLFKCPPELDFTQSVSKYSLLLFYLFFFVILAAVSTLWVISYAFLCSPSFFFFSNCLSSGDIQQFQWESCIKIKKKCPKSLSHLFFFNVPTRFLLDRIILNNGY